jgi:hypothetical protein
VKVQSTTAPAELTSAIDAFRRWIQREGYGSYDPYDIWGTPYSLAARRLYYRNKWIGLPLIAPVLAIDLICPSIRKLLLKKRRYATADAQLVLAFLNLHEIGAEESYLRKARELAEEIFEYRVKGYTGPCWGYPFAWQNNRGFHPKDTPFITCTPYCFEAFVRLHEITGEARYLEIARSIADFIYCDLNDTPAGPDALAGSYSPNDHEKVVNCSAYRAYVLVAASELFDRPDFRERAEKNINFILRSQRDDGSWLYAVDHPGDSFIDHFHTCFNLKNLFKLNHWLRRPDIEESIRKGYAYYCEHLFFQNGNPKAFAIEPRTQIVRLEMYNFAEAITVGALLKDLIPEAGSMAERLAMILCRSYQMPDGHFVTRVYAGGIKHRFPFLRWPQAQLFLALTNLLHAFNKPQGAMRPAVEVKELAFK